MRGSQFTALTIAMLLGLIVGTALAETRTWKDASGRFEIEAEAVGVEGGRVRLRKADGKEITVPLERLSQEDRDYVREMEQSREAATGASDSAETPPVKELKDLATRFYEDLRSKLRADAASLLTKKAKEVSEAGKSALVALPTPDEHKRAIRVGKAVVEGGVASVPVRVRVGGQNANTKLHFRVEEDAWRVFAISAKLPGGEKTINFEVAPSGEKKQDPLIALIGKPMPIEGVTLNGRAFDIEQYKGKVVLVDFWATWCGPCRAEMPNIAANYQKYHERGFEVVAVSIDQSMGSLKDFVAEQQPPWVVLADKHPKNRQSMAARYGISGIPALVLVGPDGKVLTAHCRGERLGRALAKQLDGAKPNAEQTAAK
ncbi:MAG: thioredoxin-like domain-containing protein [Planctomycetota bacterium]